MLVCVSNHIRQMTRRLCASEFIVSWRVQLRIVSFHRRKVRKIGKELEDRLQDHLRSETEIGCQMSFLQNWLLCRVADNASSDSLT